MTDNLSQIASELRTIMQNRHEAREQALATGRKIIQLSAKTIKHLHRREQTQAEQLLEELKNIIRNIHETLKTHTQVLNAPHFQDSIKEYVEAVTLKSLIDNQPLPQPNHLGVEPAAYLNGLCEAASELRRYALDALRRGENQEAKRLVDAIEDIYDELITFDYPDALTGNLRRSVDSLRAVLERTQSDLAVTGTQLELIAELKTFHQIQLNDQSANS